MQQSFLCPIHRKWAYLHPLEACEQIEQAKMQGESLRRQQRWDKALPYLGCALEITEIMMDTHQQRGNKYNLLYTALAIAVADTLYRLQQFEMAADTLEDCSSKLRQRYSKMVTKIEQPTYIDECIQSLKRGAQFFRERLNYASKKLH